MLIQIKQILFLDGKPVFSGRSYGERLEMGTESEKQNNNNEKCAVLSLILIV
jgi:hypothetical protein